MISVTTILMFNLETWVNYVYRRYIGVKSTKRKYFPGSQDITSYTSTWSSSCPYRQHRRFTWDNNNIFILKTYFGSIQFSNNIYILQTDELNNSNTPINYTSAYIFKGYSRGFKCSARLKSVKWRLRQEKVRRLPVKGPIIQMWTFW